MGIKCSYCCHTNGIWSIFVTTALVFISITPVDIAGSGPCVILESHGSGSGSLCIPVELINRAFAQSRHHFGLMRPFVGSRIHDHHEEIDKLGLVLQETSRIIAKELTLDWQQIYRWLPTLDTRLTDIWDFCPAQLKHKTCSVSRYRSLTGYCNNLEHPDWGATFAPFANILPPSRADGISAPRDATDGEYLPSARLVSSIMHRDAVVHDHSVTTMLIAWGQIIDHDITLTADTKDPLTLKEPECCGGGLYDAQHPKHHNCFPIEIPRNDPFYRGHGRSCMNFLRSFAGVRSDCRLGPRVAFNTISSFLDSNFVYGSTPELGAELRLGQHGLLKSLPVFHEYGLKPLLPPKTHEPDDGCIRPNADVFCFLAGDNRVNEQLVLTVLHTIFLREHNRIAESLYAINPHWEDELIFQEARRIVIATTQHITFNEFLPMILGRPLMDKYGLTLQDHGYWKGYDPKVNPSAAEEFITSAFRFGHSLLPNRIERWSHSHKYIDSESLHKLLRQPYDVYRPGYVDTFIMGLVNQLAQAMDEGVTEEVTTLLFKEPGKHFGMDLAAMNIQRGREHAVPGYTAYRKICGLSPITVWDDLIGLMRNETVNKYRSVYRSPHDIDLWSGGVSEISNPGSLLGPTFGCIIAQQFQAARFGDRFWYELPDWPSSFTVEQLQEIRKVKLSRLLCDNSDDIKTIQMYAMVFPDPDLNPRVSCQGLRLSGIDFELWRDTSTGQPIVHNHLLPEHVHYNHPHSLHTAQTYAINGSEVREGERPLDEDVIKNPYRLPAEPQALEQDTAYRHTSHQSTYEPEVVQHLGHPTHDEHPQSKPQISYITKSNLPGSYEYTSSITSSLTETPWSHNHNDPQNYTIYENTQELPPTYVTTILAEPAPVKTHLVKIPIIETNAPRRLPQVAHHKPGLPPVKPFPENHPFPGMDGLFSPNPGYLVRQQFQVYRHRPPVLTTQRPHILRSMFG